MWNSLGKNTGVDSHSLIQGIFMTQGLNLGGVSLVAQMVKNLPIEWEAGVQSLSQADPLEKGMEIHSRVLIWIIPWPEEPGGLQSMGLQRVGHD